MKNIVIHQTNGELFSAIYLDSEKPDNEESIAILKFRIDVIIYREYTEAIDMTAFYMTPIHNNFRFMECIKKDKYVRHLVGNIKYLNLDVYDETGYIYDHLSFKYRTENFDAEKYFLDLQNNQMQSRDFAEINEKMYDKAKFKKSKYYSFMKVFKYQTGEDCNKKYLQNKKFFKYQNYKVADVTAIILDVTNHQHYNMRVVNLLKRAFSDYLYVGLEVPSKNVIYLMQTIQNDDSVLEFSSRAELDDFFTNN